MKTGSLSLSLRALVAMAVAGFAAGPLWAFINGQNAIHVLGQNNFYTKTVGTSATKLWHPRQTVYDPALHWLFVVDSGNNRVLLYDLSSGITDGMAAAHVLGQPDFTTNAYPTLPSATDVYAPANLAYDPDHKQLFVSNGGGVQSVFLYDLSMGVTNYMPAAHVLGQQHFSDIQGSASQSGPLDAVVGGMYYDTSHQWLFVGDDGRGRIMVFDLSHGTTDFMPASFMWGQPDYSSTGSGLGPSTFMQVGPLAYDAASQRLIAADQGGGRVLIYDLSGTLTDHLMPAVNVLGVSDFYTNGNTTGLGPTQQGMFLPMAIAYDTTRQRLFLADTYNRLLIYSLWGGVTNDMNATQVLGQTNFGSSGMGLNANKFNFLAGVTYDADGHRLFVTDSGNNRILVFDDSDLGPNPPLVACAGVTEYSICGKVTAAEDPTTNLGSVPVMLLGAQGELLRTTKTHSDGTYNFGPADGLTGNATYFITPAVGRTMSAVPLQTAVTALTKTGATVDLKIRGWPSDLTVTTGVSGSSILISKVNFTEANAPTLNPNSASSNGFYSAATGIDGSTRVPLPLGNYFVTCWVPQLSGGTVTFSRVPSIGSLPASITPLAGQSVSCN